MHFYRKCWFDPFEEQFISPFFVRLPVPNAWNCHSLYTAFSSNVGAWGMWACSLFLSFSNKMNLSFSKFCTVIWIGLIVYKSGVLEHLSNPSHLHTKNISQNTPQEVPLKEELSVKEGRKSPSTAASQSSSSWWFQGELVDPEGAVRHSEVELWQDLSYKHWPTLFGYYNISLYGK